jgi:hypothetical protein
MADETAPPRREPPAACPYCALLLDPPPERPRLCPRCRRKIIVRRVDGRHVFLTEEAVEVFEAERQRETNAHTWTTERGRWLALARGVSAPLDRVTRLASAPPSEANLLASKELYVTAADRAVKTARHEKHWDEVARIRREQAAAMYRAAGSTVPPPDDVVELHREWSAAALRSHRSFGAQVELVAAGCCATCKRDDGKAFRIDAELKTPRLPHSGCPRGICQCDWWPVPDRTTRPKRVRRRSTPKPGPAAAPGSDIAPGAIPSTAAGSAPEHAEPEPGQVVEPVPASAAEPVPGPVPAVESEPAS